MHHNLDQIELDGLKLVSIFIAKKLGFHSDTPNAGYKTIPLITIRKNCKTSSFW